MLDNILMHIAYLQFQPLLADLEATIDQLAPLLDQAADADLIVLPELCNSGYNFESMDMARSNAEEIPKSRFVDFLLTKAVQNNSFIVSGMNELLGDKLYNSAVALGPNGYIGKYQKLHLFWNEKDFFEPGVAGLPVFEMGTARVGIQVCFDWMFPESWRALALKGADIIAHPSNLVLPGLAQRAVPIHALINRVFTLTANRIGTERELTFTGLSTIASPKGEVLRQAPQAAPEIGMIEIDLALARDKRITPRNDALADRRPEAYEG